VWQYAKTVEQIFEILIFGEFFLYLKFSLQQQNYLGRQAFPGFVHFSSVELH